MAMTVGTRDGDDHDEVMASINTTPLVDVMLVLLIIFLITIPVVSHTVPVSLPKETVQPLQTTPQNVILAVTKDGDVFWDERRVPDAATGSPYPWRSRRALRRHWPSSVRLPAGRHRQGRLHHRTAATPMTHPYQPGDPRWR
jgi:hypothetical protein